MKPAKKEKSRAYRVLSIIGTIVVYAFFAICMIALIVSVTAKKDADGAIDVFGMQMRIVISPSMEKCDQTDVSAYKIKDIPVKSMVFISSVPDDEEKAARWYADLKVGDVLTFKYVYTRQETITHRIVDIAPKEGGGYLLTLEGDNKNSDASTLTQVIDTSLDDSPDYVVGKVTAVSYGLGLLITAIKSPVGIVCIVIVPCTAILIIEIVRIVGMVNESKKKKLLQEQARKDDELEELKRKLAELSRERTAVPDDNQPKGD